MRSTSAGQGGIDSEGDRQTERPMERHLPLSTKPKHNAVIIEQAARMNVSPAAGKFRSFLLTCVKHFLANERERGQTQRRGGGQLAISLDGIERT